ncbi:hypothetical protein Pcinc_019816 [Petrolisthes cinctipes]|uniref:Uncharacterized protein n=1 Tax=Petrolisthes cinctipes TaxID=88211 RepID=A0AAE1FP02_PETCI|nr:hypothetical protein Pcinc_019816 [Petrolisthes cinctipes]
MQRVAVTVVFLVVVMVAMVISLTNGWVLMCYECDGKNNSCDDDANMTLTECGGACYRKLDQSKEFYYRQCYPFAMEYKCSVNNKNEDECFCNHYGCNDKCCDSRWCCEE